MMTRDQRIVSHVRTVMGPKPTSRYTFEELLAAYQCWHVYAAGNWQKFHMYLNDDARADVYRSGKPV